MKKIRTIIFLLFFLPISTYANNSSSVKILNWQENSVLTATGKNSEIIIQGKVGNLASNQIIKSFIFGINKERDITIKQVLCDNKPVNYTFVGNSLEIQFVRPKKNGNFISISFSYEEQYRKINKFLRQELIQIPPFASGANATVTISFPGSMESATLNPNLTKNGNSFIYRNVVPQTGVQELIKLTSTQGAWDAWAKVRISSDSALENMTVKMPIYFQNGG